MKNKHLVIASGGTGGHFYPTLAVAKSFQAQCAESRVTLLVAGMHAEEQKKIAANYGYEAREVPTVRLPRNPWQALLFPFKMFACVRAAKAVLKELAPDVVLGMGSFAAVPACMAVDTSTTPLVLHEGNAFMGKTNRWFMKKASAIGLSLPLADTSQAQGRRSERVGMPLRDAIVKASQSPNEIIQEDFLPSLGLQKGIPTVLVFGGSQGARAVNTLFTETAPLLTDLKDRLQFIHLTGTDDNDAMIAAYKQAGIRASIRRADPNIEQCYLNSGLVICRGGASSICELALFGKPIIIIPLPTAADDHQTVNATVLEDAGAACHFPQKTATPEKLSAQLRDWLDNPDKWLKMGSNLLSFAQPKAADNMVKLILDVLQTTK